MDKNINKSKKIFICYASEDRPFVIKIYNRLKKDGFDPWIDFDKLIPGQEWVIEIRKAIRNSDYVIVCLSEMSIDKSGFVQKEIKIALDITDEQPEGKIFLIPLKLRECSVPERLNHLMWVNYFEKLGHIKLLYALGQIISPQKKNKRKYSLFFIMLFFFTLSLSLVFFWGNEKANKDKFKTSNNYNSKLINIPKTNIGYEENDTSIVKRNAALAKETLTEIVQYWAESIKNASTSNEKANIRSEFANNFIRISTLPNELKESYIDYMLEKRQFFTEQDYVVQVIKSDNDLKRVNAAMKWLKEEAFKEMNNKK
jgi:hypothetical protein